MRSPSLSAWLENSVILIYQIYISCCKTWVFLTFISKVKDKDDRNIYTIVSTVESLWYEPFRADSLSSLSLVYPSHSIAQSSPRTMCTDCWECKKVESKTETFVKPRGQAKSRVEGGLGSVQGRNVFLWSPGNLIGAILLFLGLKALCSLLYCFNIHQEISPCSGSAMPLVPACGRPGGKCTGLF